MAEIKLNLLIVEDSESDVHLIAHLLRKAGYDLNYRQVQDAGEMRRALLEEPWDVIVSDFYLPQFDGLSALQLRQSLAPDVPCIILSGAAGEARAVELLHAGASDFISKSKFPRLVQVIEREMAQAKIRRAHAQEQLELQKERLRFKAILDGAVDAIILIDAQGKVLSFNPAAETVFGYKAQQMLGQNVDKLMPNDVAQQHDAYLRRYLETGEARMMGKGREVIGQRSNGELFPMDLSISSWSDGDQHYFIGVVRDITEHKMIQSQLAQTQKMESLMQLSGGLAHDFNNLLGIIIGNLDLLQLRVADDEKNRAHVDAALRAALRGADITRRMLSLSRMQHGTARDKRPQVVNALIDEITAILHRTLGPNYAISTALLPDLPNAKLDPGEFENVILNLALNARDAMPNGGHLIISTRLVSNDELILSGMPEHQGTSSYILVEISDTGVGMTPEVLANAMTPFFTTKTGSGTGLGLSMVYGFVKALDGHIRIYSELGYGTAVHLYLPVAAHATGEHVRVSSSVVDVTHGSETILLVDDEVDLLALAVEHLNSLGYQTYAAENAAEAMVLLKNTPGIDLLLTDVVMPGGMLGTELALNAQQLRPDLPVILCSGFPKKIQEDPRYAEFALDILPKPFRKTDLAQAVRRKLDRAANGSAR